MKSLPIESKIKELFDECLQGRSSKVLLQHELVNILYTLQESAKIKDISETIRNRGYFVVLQHLQLLNSESIYANSLRIGRFTVRLKKERRWQDTDAGVVIASVDFSRAVLPALQLRDISFYDCVFEATTLTKLKLRECRFERCNLQEAILTDAQIRTTNFSGSTFEGAILDGARIRGCSLTGCNLQYSKIRNCDFTTTKLTGCNFDSADTHGSRGL